MSICFLAIGPHKCCEPRLPWRDDGGPTGSLSKKKILKEYVECWPSEKRPAIEQNMALSSGTSFQLVNSNEQFETVFAIKLSDELLTTLLAKEKRPALKLHFSADSTGVR